MNPIRILAVEDSQTFLHGLERVLEFEPGITIVGTATCGDEAVAQAARLAPDVVLLDLRITWQGNDAPPAQEKGLRAIREIKAKAHARSIVVLTSHTERKWVIQVVEAGASGFVSKDAPSDEIAAAVRTAARGGVVLTAEQLEWVRDNADLLTAREKEVLALLDQGLSDIEIAQRLHIERGTASKHVENIRQKLEARSRSEAVALARQRGLI